MVFKGFRTKADTAAAILFMIVTVPPLLLILNLFPSEHTEAASTAYLGWINLLMVTVFFSFTTITGWRDKLKNLSGEKKTTEMELGLYSLGLSQITQTPLVSYYFGGLAALCFLATIYDVFILSVRRKRNTRTS